ncbi:MAG: PilC/PilY family type IV pilus protein [Colwellia sp.]
MKKYLLAGLILTVSNFTFSEDIELYISDSAKQSKARPQVLIIFDNSGSMTTVESVKSSYDPAFIYPAVNGLNSLSDKFIYFTKGGVDGVSLPVPDSPSESRRFLADINSCQTAKDILDDYGFYTGHVREYDFQGNSGSWIEVPDNNGANIDVIDCEDDVLAVDETNAGVVDKHGAVNSIPDGFPVNGEGSKANPLYHTTDVDDANVTWSGSLVTLYTDNYLRWYQSDVIAFESKTRIEIAKESVTNLINSSPYVDFGLQVFNDDEGGRIVFGITESTLTNRADILDLINNNISAETWTPLCETLYEASRYFAGKSVDYGDADYSTGHRGTRKPTPERDESIEAENPETSEKFYKSPFDSCSDKAYVIIITDGEPTYDIGADTKISNMPETGQDPMGSSFYISEPQSYERGSSMLPALAGWMNSNDLNTSVDGKQTVTTYTIGFGQDAQDDAELLLKETATLGGGKYFPADDTASLTAALTNVLANLEPSNDSLTSASVAANNFDRTETLNSVYYAMFQPDRGPRWQGNLKKYKVVGGEQVGKNGNSAIDEATGHFSTEVTSFWSSTKDGEQVAKGGIADMLRKKSNRMIYSDIGTADALVELNSTNAFAHFGSAQYYADFIGVDVLKVPDYFNWNLGIDVDDEDEDGSTTDMRYDVFGDPLHSKPLVVNYGDKIHLVIGTNAGALHMFKDSGDTVDETWAFMPKEFFPNIKKLRNNYSTDDKIYGIDGKITSYINDVDGDGIIEAGDTVWIFFGLRRGGTSYYAVDISNPNSPSLLWHIDANTSGFSEMGQSWSQPKLGYSKINIVSDVAKPVLFFGGGYDYISKDTAGIGTADNVGRAIYMVDAQTGTLKWSMAPTGATTSYSGTDSIPSSISTLDSDGDGLVDRLYTGDTGGNVWRVDMPSNNPTGSEPWSVFKLASLGGDADNGEDRRFFNEPSVVRTFITETIESQVTDASGHISTVTVHQEIPYDAVLLGSGDRSNPLGIDTKDKFFMIKDKNIITETFPSSATPPTPITITINDLYNFTDNPFSTVSDEGRQALSVAVSKKSGWYFDLEQEGEKNTASATVINNTVYFTTFTPPNLTIAVEGCELPNGKGWLYGVDLALGIKKFNWKSDGSNDSKDREDRISYISEQFLGSPTLIVIPKNPSDPNSITEGNLIVGRKIVSVGFNLQTMRTYLYVTEDQ